MISGLAINHKKLFVGTQKGILEFDVAETPSLTELCVQSIRKNQQLWSKEELESKLPQELIERIMADPSKSVQFIE
jgi:hypothetical protein